MAQQKGILPLQGTIGNVTFYKSKDGYLARSKGGVAAERIATDPAFQRTRENGAEFGRAGKAGKLLRVAVRTLSINASDSKMTGRLTREMVKVVQADATNARGERNVIDGEATLLTGFEFNASGRLSATLFAPYTGVIDRAAGTMTIHIPEFVPINMMAAPNGATHFKINSAGVSIDFEGYQYESDVQQTEELPWTAKAIQDITLINQVSPNSSHPQFLLLGIEFYQFVNGFMYSLKNGAFNALRIVTISGNTP